MKPEVMGFNGTNVSSQSLVVSVAGSVGRCRR